MGWPQNSLIPATSPGGAWQAMVHRAAKSWTRLNAGSCLPAPVMLQGPCQLFPGPHASPSRSGGGESGAPSSRARLGGAFPPPAPSCPCPRVWGEAPLSCLRGPHLVCTEVSQGQPWPPGLTWASWSLRSTRVRLPLRFGLRPQGPCRVGTGESGLVLSEEGNPAGLSILAWEIPCTEEPGGLQSIKSQRVGHD